MVPIRTITLTLGRNRQTTPMSGPEWLTFQRQATALLTELAGTEPSWIETHYGVGEWDGVREESVRITLLDALEVPALGFLDAVSALAATYGQDAIAFATGTSVLLTASHTVSA